MRRRLEWSYLPVYNRANLKEEGTLTMKKTLRMILLLAAMVCALCLSAGAEELSGNCGAEGDGSNVTYGPSTWLPAR